MGVWSLTVRASPTPPESPGIAFGTPRACVARAPRGSAACAMWKARHVGPGARVRGLEARLGVWSLTVRASPTPPESPGIAFGTPRACVARAPRFGACAMWKARQVGPGARVRGLGARLGVWSLTVRASPTPPERLGTAFRHTDCVLCACASRFRRASVVTIAHRFDGISLWLGHRACHSGIDTGLALCPGARSVLGARSGSKGTR